MERIRIILLVAILTSWMVSCKPQPEKNDSFSTENVQVQDYDPLRGEGKYKEIKLGNLDFLKAKKGKAIYETKCHSCHRLTDEKLVGPGWKGVTGRHQPEWILNFITNPDPMLDKDPKLLAMMELCLIRMPNQNISESDAFAVLEFMRQNDGVK